MTYQTGSLSSGTVNSLRKNAAMSLSMSDLLRRNSSKFRASAAAPMTWLRARLVPVKVSDSQVAIA